MPLKRIWIFLILSCSLSLKAKKYTIMLSPAGDAEYAGRELVDGFERGFTRQFAEALKEELEQCDALRVVMTHDSGESATQEQKANFANRLEVDLYIAINFYPDEKRNLLAYSYKTALFDVPQDESQLYLYPTTKSYVINGEQTKRLAACWNQLEKYQASMESVYAGSFPLKELEGIVAPAFVLEMGAQKMADIHDYVKPVVQVLLEMAHETKS